MLKLGFCSPLGPLKTGIADFSEELIFQLKKYFSVDLFCLVEPGSREIREQFAWYPIEKLQDDDFRRQYDAVLYEMGNNIDYHKKIGDMLLKHSGFLEIHDLCLHNYLAADTLAKNDVNGYLSEVRYCHGEQGVKIAQEYLAGRGQEPWSARPLEMPVNKRFIDRSQGVIVHSDFAKQYVKAISPNVPVVCIYLHTPDIMENFQDYEAECRKKLQIDGKQIIFGSFGFVSKDKRIFSVLNALARYRDVQPDFHYYIVGKAESDTENLVRSLNLQDKVTITGYTTLEEFKLYMGACDVGLNLRYPTHGESSASLHRMLGFGKPVIVTNIGSFEEYPDDIVVKVGYDEHEVEEIYQALCNLTKDRKRLDLIAEKAVRYARENYDQEKNTVKYAGFLESVLSGTYQDEPVDRYIDMLFRMGLTDDEYIRHLLDDGKLKEILGGM